MSQRLFHILVGLATLAFAAYFFVAVMPPAFASGDFLGAFAAGFVNPFAAGYATDAILCWVILTIWIVYERQTLNVPHGWICILLGIIPGVAVGFGLYLILRSRHLMTKDA